MRHMIETVLSSPNYPEYGVATIAFPIPRNEYDYTVELMEGIGIGDPLRRDCMVCKMDSGYSVLKRLEGQAVNIDELDYLAKRLDSFSEGKDSQFQAYLHETPLPALEIRGVNEVFTS